MAYEQRTDTTEVIGGHNAALQVTMVAQTGDTVRVRVIDADLAGQVLVTVGNDRTGESESILLAQDATMDSVFFGQVRTTSQASVPGDSTLEVAKGDTLLVTYNDTLTLEGGTATLIDDDEVVDPFGDADGNGQVQAFDAARVLYHVLWPYLTGLDSLTTNVDLGAPLSTITPFDASLILQKRVGMLTRFPVQEDESVNHPQPETDQSTPKVVADERVLALQLTDGAISLHLDERAGIVSGDLLLEGVSGAVELAPELSDFLLASRPMGDGLRIVLAGAFPLSGPGELLRIRPAAGAAGARLVQARFNDGQIVARLDESLPAAALPTRFALYPNHPNPANPNTSIRFDVPEAGAVELAVFDVLGRRVRSLLSDDVSVGSHVVTWDGRDDWGREAASGVYLYRVVAGDFVAVERMLLLK